jgi:hypothetical protein
MAVILVKSAAQLRDALKAARSGDTVELSGGNYGKLDLRSTDFKGVTLASSSKSNPAVFDRVDLNKVSNLQFKGIKFDYSPSKTGASEVVRIIDSKGIRISDSVFDGHLNSSGHGTGKGMTVRRSSDIVVENSDLADFYITTGFFFVDNLVLRGNTFSGIGHDGANMVQVRKGLIENNTFQKFNGPNAKHQDFIQFWSKDAKAPSSDITIRKNVFDSGHSLHAIWMGNSEARDGDRGMFYKNVRIEDNLIRLGDPNGITVEHAVGVTIRNNTLQKHKDAASGKHFTPLISVSAESANVNIVDNVAPSVPGLRKSDWTVSGNATSGVDYKHWAGHYKGKLHWLDSAKDQKASGGAGVRGDVGASATSSKASSVAKVVSWEGVQQAAVTEKVAEKSVLAASSVATKDFGDLSVDFGAAKTTTMGSGSTYRFNNHKSDRVDIIKGLDFDSGDSFRLARYDDNTFLDKKGGNFVQRNKEGSFVVMDHILDLHELVEFSPNISASVDVRADTLIFRIEQKAGIHTFVMEGMGKAFLDSYQPELF